MSEAKAGPVAGVASDTAPVTGALTAERRKMIAARLAALAPGDWTVDGTCVDGEIAIRAFPDEGDEDAEPALIAIVFADDDLCIDGEAAAEFIAHAREDMPDLLAALQHAERERGEAVKDAERWKARLREVVDGWRDTTTDSMEYDDLLDTMDAYLNGRIITQSDGAARAIASGRE